MAKITYIQPAGEARVVEVRPGTSVMEGAVKNSIAGIDGDCGGVCSCATCHVYVDEAWTGRTGVATQAESDMLDFTQGVVRRNSRLSCQIKVTEALDGLLVRLPDMPD